MTDRPLSQRALLTCLPKNSESAWSHTLQHPVPVPSSTQILVKTSHVGLNPFDWQAVAYKLGLTEVAKVTGRDGSGVVVEVGANVKEFKVGDRVWFCSNSALACTGAFQEYSTHEESELGHTPDHLTDEEAATLGTGLITAGIALFKTLDIPFDADKSEQTIRQADEKTTLSPRAPWILIWGGAGITGIFLIQLARILGYRVICAASPVNHAYVKNLGAQVVLDRWLERDHLLEMIRIATNDDVKIAIDNVGKETAAICQQVLAGSTKWRKTRGIAISTIPETSRLVALAGYSASQMEPSPDSIRQVQLPRISFSTTFYGHPDFSSRLLGYFEGLLTSGTILPARPNAIGGGLLGIESGLDRLRNGKGIGGYKLVIHLEDQPLPVSSLPTLSVGTRKRNAEIIEKPAISVKRQKVSV